MILKTITPELITAYWFCPRKAFLLMRGEKGAARHEYVEVMERQALANRKKNLEISKTGAPGICELFLATSTHNIGKDQKIQLAAMAYLLTKSSGKTITSGTIMNAAGTFFQVKLTALIAEIAPLVETLESWVKKPPLEAPGIILIRHCQICPFRQACFDQAKIEDNLSLLDRVTPKVMKKYKKQGIFTVRQLSYLYRPRRERKRSKPAPVKFDVTLQALALREQKIYVQETPIIPAHPVEIFIDFEGLPDQEYDYLIGMMVSENGRAECHSFWADTAQDEKTMFENFLHAAAKYPDAPIYHYGHYEFKSLIRIGKKYNLDIETVKKRLMNVSFFVFGKIYFPARSNNLKDIGNIISAVWTEPGASGLHSIAWRMQWDVSQNVRFKQKLLTYNAEDCAALRILLVELRSISAAAETRADVDFAGRIKPTASPAGQAIHHSLEQILRSAHAEYHKNRIGIRQRDKDDKPVHIGGTFGHTGVRRIIPKPDRVVHVKPITRCPKHPNEILQPDEDCSHTVIDLEMMPHGFQKVITKYTGKSGYCGRCYRRYLPPRIKQLSNQLFGHNMRAWVVFQRVVLRLSYSAISQVCEELFREPVTDGTIGNFMKDFGNHYAKTEEILFQKIFASPFMHVDETRISVQGADHYVWVFTNGTHVVFRLTETRESGVIQELLKNYKGILISDFYGGYDAFACRQQKCLVHLIRDLNDELWKNPHHPALEAFVGAVKELLTPLMQDVQTHGLRRRHLRRHEKRVAAFYQNTIDNQTYKDETLGRYQKRFSRYRDSLFRFLQEDHIPWNNNMAERAIRHLAIQRKISGSFYKGPMISYLRLLGIAQSCRFQKKSFLGFMLSGKKDVDEFHPPRRQPISEPAGGGVNAVTAQQG